ncbi:MAG: hypothetical protein ABR570_03520 [Burkholderiales bacterium]
MARHFPAAYAAGEEIRYMYRANHVYLLFASLLDVVLGCYWPSAHAGWRGKLAVGGAALLIAAPFVLLYAFFADPPQASAERGITFVGVLLVLLGAAAQLANRRIKEAQ